MKLSVESCVLRQRFGDFEAIQMVKDAGFDAIDYSFYDLDDKGRELVLGENHVEYAREVKKALDAAGISCNQAHAPTGIGAGITYDMSDDKYRQLVYSLESASVLGAENLVIHAISTDNETNYSFYKSLEPYCKKFGIKIGVENLLLMVGNDFKVKRKLGTPDELNELIHRLDSDCFTMCLDTGHAQLTYDSAEAFISGLTPEKLKALHLHDNNLTYDDHMLPYTGKMNWEGIVKALKDINYSGDLTFEILTFLESFTTKETLQAALNLANSVGRDLLLKLNS